MPISEFQIKTEPDTHYLLVDPSTPAGRVADQVARPNIADKVLVPGGETGYLTIERERLERFARKNRDQPISAADLVPAAVAEQSDLSTREAYALAKESPNGVLVVTDQGEFKGVVWGTLLAIRRKRFMTRLGFKSVEADTTLGELATLIKTTDIGRNTQNLFLTRDTKGDILATSVRVIALAHRRLPTDTPLDSLPAVRRIPGFEQDAMSTRVASALAKKEESGLLAVLEEGEIIGLIEGREVHRGLGEDFFAGSGLSELYGSYVTGSMDGRADIQVSKPTCPHCNQQTHFEYRVRKDEFYCPECKKTIDL
jgi:hypothetical protein